MWGCIRSETHHHNINARPPKVPANRSMDEIPRTMKTLAWKSKWTWACPEILTNPQPNRQSGDTSVSSHDFQTHLDMSTSRGCGSSVTARDFLFVGFLNLKALPFSPEASPVGATLLCLGLCFSPYSFLCHSLAQCPECVLVLGEPLCCAHRTALQGQRQGHSRLPFFALLP